MRYGGTYLAISTILCHTTTLKIKCQHCFRTANLETRAPTKWNLRRRARRTHVAQYPLGTEPAPCETGSGGKRRSAGGGSRIAHMIESRNRSYMKNTIRKIS
jgi:hypothetical protein